MKKKQICEGFVEYVDFPNKAVVTTKETDADGKEKEYKVVVKGALPGQTVKFVVTKARRDKCLGRLKEVIKPSELETAQPMCPKFGTCGGCNYQSLPYETQLDIKKNQVIKLIDGAYDELTAIKAQQTEENTAKPLDVKKDYIYDGIFASPNVLGYRNKMEFSFGDEYKGGPLALGLHRKGSVHDVVNATDCAIIHEDYSKVMSLVCSFFAEREIPHYNKNTHTGVLRHLLVRRSETTGEMIVALVTSSQGVVGEKENVLSEAEVAGEKAVSENSGEGTDVKKTLEENASIKNKITKAEDKDISGENAAIEYKITHKQIRDMIDILAEKLKKTELKGSITGFIHIINDGLGDVVKSDETRIIFGKDWFMEEVLGLKFKVSTFSFFQTNTKGAEVLYSKARNYILGDESGAIDFRDKTVFDLYSGTGTIAQIIAPVAKKVIGVEIVEEAVKAARENAALNNLDNCEFIAGDVLKVIDEIEEKPDFIILDPPRDGIHPKALTKIIDYGVDRIVYISCKPTSLARDLVVFEQNGYHMERMCNVDMFPETVHVETVTLLQKVNS